MLDLGELSDLVVADPAGAAARISELLSSGGEPPAMVSALWSLLARARLMLGEVDLAEQAGERARRLAEADGDAEGRADAHLVLASVMSFAGRFDDAVAHLAVCDEIGSADQQTRAELQRAAIAQRTGRISGAIEAYRRVLPRLREQAPGLDLANVLANLGVIDVQAGRVREGIDELAQARQVFQAQGQSFAAAQMTHNLGWANGRLGDVPAALAQFSAAVAEFESLGHSPDESAFERAEVLLAAGLSTDALGVARDSLPILQAAGNRSIVAETLLLCSSAARLSDDPGLATRHAMAAKEVFDSLDNPAGAMVASLEALRATVALRPLDRDELAQVLEIEDQLARSGNAQGALSAAALATTAAAVLGDGGAARAAADRCAARAEDVGTLDSLLQVSAALSHRAVLDGTLQLARQFVDEGLKRLRRHQAMIGSVVSRAQVARHGEALGTLGISIARQTGMPEDLFSAIEQSRASALAWSGTRPPEDPALVEIVGRLREVAAQLRADELSGAPTGELRSELRRLEAALRSSVLSRGASDSSVSDPLPLDELMACLGGRRMLQLALVDESLVGVCVADGGDVRVVDLGSGAAASAAGRRAARALATLASSAVRNRASAVATFGASIAELDALVGVLAPGDEPLVLLPPAGWTSFPWTSLPSWRGRPITMAPSASWWARRSDPPTASRVVAVAGPNLTHADSEAVRVARSHPSGLVISSADATVGGVIDAIEGADLVHLAAHGHLRRDNPYWSWVELSDGPMMVYDLERLGRSPATMVLSTCDALAPGASMGEEVLGLTTALLGSGSSTVIAAIGPLPDRPETVELLGSFHDRLAAGVAPSTALAQVMAIEGDTTDDGFVPVAACLAVVGRGC